jgi:glycine oxidase
MGAPGRVVVVGGGVIGLAAAYRLAASGASVRLIDASGTRGASWAAAGMLAPISEAVFGEEALTRLNLSAVAEFTRFAGELAARTGRSVGVRGEGTLALALTADDRVALDRLGRFRDSLGLATRTLTGSQARRLEPFLTRDVRGGMLAADDLSVDNRRYAEALIEACEQSGVARTSASVTGLVRTAGEVSGVEVDGQELPADLVVIAAGAASSELLDLPLRPVKGQILRLRVPERLTGTDPVLRHTVRGLVHGDEIYLVPRAGGEIVVGATSEQQGFDITVTAGGIYQLLRSAYELLPVSSEFTFVEARAGIRPGTPDNGPLVGLYEPGLVVACGHYRNGILLSALTAEAVLRVAAGERLAEEWEAFGPRRFETGHPDPGTSSCNSS